MSGCCGQSPVIVNGPQPARVDVETLLLCDVLPDGTVAGRALVEPVYDTSSGARIATRIVDPETGAPYTVQGELQQCDPPPCLACETLTLCDMVTTSSGGEAPERITNGTFATDANGWTLTNSARWWNSAGADGQAGLLDFSPQNGVPGSAEQTVTVTPGVTYAFSARFGVWNAGGADPSVGRIQIFDGAGAVLFQQDVTPTFAGGNPAWPADGVIGPVNITATDGTMRLLVTDISGGNGQFQTDLVMDNVSLLGPGVPAETTTTTTPFLRTTCRNCQGQIVSTTDTTMDGTAEYVVQGTVAACSADPGCASPTTPVTTVGLCLADGTPIAVTVVRDCEGTVTSEGWINLTTGAWSAGAVPAGAIACGDTRSIQVSGVFCDIDGTGEVVGLVLIEYSYDEAGAIESVRLVDAVTGGTYTPQGTITTCPAGVEQPEQDVIQLCDVLADGTRVPIVRDFRRDENGVIVGHSDYRLDGTAYIPQGTVGLCEPPSCVATQVCVQDSGVADFRTNPENQSSVSAGSKTVDPNWEWSPSLSGPWYPTYDVQPISSWTVEDSDTANPAHWIAPHWNGFVVAPPDDAPAPDVPGDYYLRATFNLGDSVDPATVRISASVMNADNSVVEWRVNGGAWHPVTNSDFDDPPVTFTDVAVPDAHAGANEILVHARESSPGNSGSSAGLLLHITAAWDAPGQQTWTRVDCSDGTQYYLDETGDRIDALPPGTQVVPCSSAADCSDCETLPLCDVQPDVQAVLPGFGTPDRQWQTLPNEVRWMKRGTDGALPGGWYNADTTATPERFDFDRPVSVRYTVRFSGPTAAPLRIPAGWYLNGLNVVQHAWNAATRTISPTASATQAGESTFRIETRTVQAMRAPTVVGAQPPGQTSQYGQITVTADVVTPFLRTVCRDCTGAVVSTTDTTPDGADYAVQGEVGQCERDEPSCQHCESIVLCDEGADDPATITGLNVSSGTLSNGVAWTSRVTQAAPSRATNVDGAWWNTVYSFPNPVVGPQTWTFDRPVNAEFSVYIQYAPTGSQPQNQVQLPAGVTPVALPNGYTYDEATRILTVDATADPNCTNLRDPRKATSARFRTVSPVTSLTLAFLGARIASCGQFGNWAYGAFEVTPPGQFLRTICRDCDGTVISTTDAALDGTPYVLVGNAKQCQPQTCGGCETEQLCGPVERVVNGKFGATSSGWTLTGNVTFNAADPDASGGTGFLVYSQSEATPNGVASQTISTTAGKAYTFSARVGTRGSVNASAMLVEVLSAAGAVLYSQTVNLPAGSAAWPAAGIVGPVDVRATDGALTLRFTDRTVNTNSTDVALDNVSLLETVSFLRTICRECDGTVTSVTDTEFNGTTPVAVLGDAHPCESSCRDCETQQLCDRITSNPGSEGAITPTDGQSSGIASNGVEWSAADVNGAPVRFNEPGADSGYWVGIQTYPANSAGLFTWTFDTPVTVEFGIVLVPSGGPSQTMPLPAGVRPVSLPAGYSYDAATNSLISTVPNTSGGPGCQALANPSREVAARFITTGPVTSLTIDTLQARPVCTQIGMVRVGAFVLNPEPVPFLRTICRDCDGMVISVTDTTLDGTTAYDVLGAASSCDVLPPPQDCCQPTPVCIQQNPEQTIHFITNERHLEDNTVDPVWKWSLTPDDPAATWYDMYEGAHGWAFAWTVTDTDTERPAWWLSAHPDGNSAQSSPPRPNEGPSLVNTHWYARAFFDLPAGADPGSIQVQVTVLNADQFARAFRLNNGPWQPLPASACYSLANGCVAYTFGPGSIPGAQAGRNYLYLDVEETVGGASGLMAHLIVTYQIGRPEQRSWTRMVCCDGTAYYLDEAGVRQDALLDGWSVVPCGVNSHPVVLCDDLGTFLRHVTYTSDGQVLISDTTPLGDPYNPTGTVRAC